MGYCLHGIHVGDRTIKLIIATLLTSLALTSPIPRSTYPKGYIPFWSQSRGGHETALINTQQIVRIVPIYNKNDDGKVTGIKHLDCYLTDGIKIEISENFEEFYKRVRQAQSK